MDSTAQSSLRLDQIGRIRPWQREGTLLPILALFADCGECVLLARDQDAGKFVARLLPSQADATFATI